MDREQLASWGPGGGLLARQLEQVSKALRMTVIVFRALEEELGCWGLLLSLPLCSPGLGLVGESGASVCVGVGVEEEAGQARALWKRIPHGEGRVSGPRLGLVVVLEKRPQRDEQGLSLPAPRTLPETL